ncbi:MAG: type IX secretion system membrane protein PorP/SprF [Cytophagales bacterium]|nr:type IX secretion system membrane protein PorP/SprF [Cytophagales bacterium]
MKKVLPLALVLASFLGAQAQQDPLFAHYMFNPMHFNPAYAGVEGYTKITALHRSQWLGAGYGLQTQYLGLNTPIFNLRSGAGFFLVNDNNVHRNNIMANATYAYHLAVDKSKLSFGLKAGIYSTSINFRDIRVNDTEDEYLLDGQEVYSKFDLGLGAFWQSEKYFLGLSVDHLANSNFSIASDPLRANLRPNLYFLGGYIYEVNYNLWLRPSVLFRSDFSSFSFDASTIATYNEKLWGGASYRWQDAITLLMGYNLTKEHNLSLGFAFDIVVSNADAKAATSMEFMLSYLLPVDFGSTKKIIRTPRFRH